MQVPGVSCLWPPYRTNKGLCNKGTSSRPLTRLTFPVIVDVGIGRHPRHAEAIDWGYRHHHGQHSHCKLQGDAARHGPATACICWQLNQAAGILARLEN